MIPSGPKKSRIALGCKGEAGQSKFAALNGRGAQPPHPDPLLTQHNLARRAPRAHRQPRQQALALWPAERRPILLHHLAQHGATGVDEEGK